MRTSSNELQRNLIIGSAITMATIAFAIAVQRRKSLTGSTDQLICSCESALKKLGERVSPLIA